MQMILRRTQFGSGRLAHITKEYIEFNPTGAHLSWSGIPEDSITDSQCGGYILGFVRSVDGGGRQRGYRLRGEQHCFGINNVSQLLKYKKSTTSMYLTMKSTGEAVQGFRLGVTEFCQDPRVGWLWT
ncbi:unnamed protein product [Prorocentrum cordatum]|uniref:Uncharacterized protein n=1 Tax=Prorocentrum cordatum TaxID=2364126 RepID=A0ABN9VKK7_9DINO|nr:unnamed protein product [Polarella glacialis]